MDYYLLGLLYIICGTENRNILIASILSFDTGTSCFGNVAVAVLRLVQRKGNSATLAKMSNLLFIPYCRSVLLDYVTLDWVGLSCISTRLCFAMLG